MNRADFYVNRVRAIAAELMDDETQTVATVSRRAKVRDLAENTASDPKAVAADVIREYVRILDRVAGGAR